MPLGKKWGVQCVPLLIFIDLLTYYQALYLKTKCASNGPKDCKCVRVHRLQKSRTIAIFRHSGLKNVCLHRNSKNFVKPRLARFPVVNPVGSTFNPTGNGQVANLRYLSPVAAPEKSDRQLAKAIGVDHKTVSAQRVELEKSGEIPHFTARQDPRTGRLSQPAFKPISIPVGSTFNPTGNGQVANLRYLSPVCNPATAGGW